MNSVNPALVSDELWDKSIGRLNADPLGFSPGYKDRIIHMIDAVSRGNISPLEAYDALDADYFPVHLEVRESAYSYLLA